MGIKNKLLLSTVFMLAASLNPFKSSGQSREMDKKGDTTELPAQSQNPLDIINSEFGIVPGSTSGDAGGILETEFAGAELEGGVFGKDINRNNKLETDEFQHAYFFSSSEKMVTIDKTKDGFEVNVLAPGEAQSAPGGTAGEYKSIEKTTVKDLKTAVKTAKAMVLKM